MTHAIEIRARARSSATRCAVCHDELQADEPTRSCWRCRSVAHAECRDEIDGCPTLACGGSPNSSWRVSRRMSEVFEPPAGCLPGMTELVISGVLVGLILVVLVAAAEFRNALDGAFHSGCCAGRNGANCPGMKSG